MKIAQIHTETYGTDFWDVILLPSLDSQLSASQLSLLGPLAFCFEPPSTHRSLRHNIS